MTLLDNKVYESHLLVLSEEMKDEIVCFSVDRWSNIQNEHIICVCITTETGKVYMVNKTDTSGQRIIPMPQQNG